MQPENDVYQSRSVSLACGSNAPSLARRFVRSLDLGDDCPVVELLVSELVTNAVTHARSDTKVTIGSDVELLRVTVSDSCSATPHLRQADETGGRGLRLVDELSTRWGSDPVSGDGKRVWFELRRGPQRARYRAAAVRVGRPRLP